MPKVFATLSLLFATLTLVALPVQEAEAKRMGSGKSLGSQYSVPAKKSPPPASAPNQAANQPAAAPRQSGASRWLGPLAGLAAGGLLASLFFGDAFEGFQIMDFLLIAALVFGAVMLFRAMRSRAPVPHPAGGPPLGGAQMPGADFGAADAAPGTARPSEGSSSAPGWFEGERFAEGAKMHFIRLQAAWDKGDMKDIAEYTTPELFAELQAGRLERSEERHFTEVASLFAELTGVQRDGDKVVASVRFSGRIRETQDGPAEEFAEVWHVVHAWDRPDGDWLIAGITQDSADRW